MVTVVGGTRVVAVVGALGLVIGLGGCAAKVTREDFNTEVARLREEVKAGDAQLGSRIDSTNQLVTDHTRRLDALDQELQAFRSEYNVTIERTKDMMKCVWPIGRCWIASRR
jgi:hypothetical protein